MCYLVRPARPEDCEQILGLMKGLAEFEGYLEDFKVTTPELIRRGFPEKGRPDFYALIAEKEKQLSGMLIYYTIPFTYDLRPTLYIKELYIASSARGLGLGKALFESTVKIANEQKCGRIKWDVLHNNEPAKRFYTRHGATRDNKWHGYILDL